MVPPAAAHPPRPPLRAACILLLTLAALLLVGGVRLPGTAEAQTNSKPTLSATEPGFRTIRENAAVGSTVGDPIDGTDADGNPITYTLKGLFGADNTTFSIDSSTGQLTTNVPLDFESTRSFLLLVDLEDDQGAFSAFFFGVVVLDVDEPPAITRTSPSGQSETDSTALTLESNTAGGTIASFTASDPERDAVSWSVSGTDADDFSIDSTGKLSLDEVFDVGNPTDADGDNVYEVTVLATDSGGNVSEGHDVTVTATLPPTGIVGPTTIVRNEGGTSYVGWYSLRGRPSDSGNGRWVLSGDDAGDFDLTHCANQTCPGISGDAGFHYASLRFKGKNPPDFSSRADKDRDNVFEVNVEWRYGSPEQSLGKIPVTVKIYDVGGAPRVTRSWWDVDSVAVSVIDGDWLATQPMTIKDPDDRDLTVVVAGPDGHLFKAADQMFGGAYVLQIKIYPDFDAPTDDNGDNVYEFIVKAHNGVSTSMLPWRLTVKARDEKPRLHGPTKTKFEVGSTATVATFIGADDEDASVTFSLRGPQASKFNISSAGVLTYTTAPTAATTSDDVVRIRVTDSAGKFAEQELKVTVVASGTNNAPTAITGPGSKNKAENSGFVEMPGNIGTFRTTDADSDTIYWSLSGADAGHFWIGGDGLLRLIKNLDFEDPADANTDNTYEVTVHATDGIASVSKAVTVTATDVNEPPLATGDLHVEVAGGSTTVAGYTATNPEATHDTPQTVTWSVVGKDADDFSISSSGALTFSTAPDASSPADADTDNVYHVVVKATDNGTPSSFDTLPVTVTVTGNSAPSISSGAETKNHAENSTAVIGTYAATDADGDPITWSLSGSDAGLFQITGGGVLSFRSPPDFDDPPCAGADNTAKRVCNVTVNASDGTDTATRAVAVTVTDLDEAPVVSGSGFVEINAGATDLSLATYTATDPEGETGVTWSIVGVLSGTQSDADPFQISATGELSFKAAPQFNDSLNGDSVYLLTVRARIGSKTGHLLVTVAVKQQNRAPTITAGGATVSFAENGTGHVHTYIASDPEDDTITWSLTGTDADDFSITGGVLTFSPAPDFEDPQDDGENNVYNVTVVASDGVNQATRDVTVTVTGVDEAPTLTGPTGVSFDENQATSTTVATFTAGDPEAETVTLALSGTDSSSLTLTNTTDSTTKVITGKLTFNNSPDHETKDSYSVTLTVTGDDGTDTIDLTITIADVDETLSWTAGRTTRTINEGTTFIGNYSVSDPEGASISWGLSGTDSDSFESLSGVAIATAVLRLASAADHETKSSYSVTVEATAGSHTISRAVTVTVNNDDDAGTVTVPASPQVNSDATATLSDPDGGVTSLTWQWQQWDGTTATDISGATTATYRPVSGDQGKKLRAVASYTDAQGANKTATGTSTNNVGARANAAPTFSGTTASRSIDENAASGTALGAAITASDTDTEDANALTYSLEDLSGAPFTVNSSTGQISTSGALDHEANSSHTFTLKVTDGPGATDTISVTVTVNDVEEAGSISLSPSLITVGTAVTATLTDGDGGVTSPTWQWKRVDESTNPDTVTDISGATSSSYTTTSDDSGMKLRVTVNYTDRRGSGKTATATTANSVGNEPPSMTCSTTSTSVAENSTATIVTYAASDPEGQTITWSVKGTDSDDFSVDGGSLSWAAAPNYERPTDTGTNNVYSVTVAASDGDNEATCTITITVTNVDETGTLTLSPSDPEATVAVSATLDDPDGESSVTYQWSLRTNGQVDPITGATSSSYTPKTGDIGKFLRLTVTYMDSFGSKTLTADSGEITAKANRPPEFTTAAKAQTTLSVAENTAAGTNIGARFAATDADGETLSWSLSGGTDDDSFSVVSTTGQLRTKAALDHETKTSYSVRIRVTDPSNEGDTHDVTITVTDVDEAPEYTGDAAQSYDETRTDAVATFTASDPEGGSVTWADLSGTDAADFSFDKGTGVLSFVTQPDFENPADSNRNNEYLVTLGATDGNNKSSTHRVTVTVVNIDEEGEITFPILQPQVTIPFVAELSDPDGGVTNVQWQWSVGASPGDATNIEGATRDRYEPRVDDIGSLLHVGATYTDRHGRGKQLTASSSLSVLEAPPEPFAPEFPAEENGVREIEENREANAQIGFAQIGLPVAATDANEGDALTYSLDSASEALFSIEATSGQLSARTALDYETRRSYRVRVTATDPSGRSDTITVTINVIDVDEEPAIEFLSGAEEMDVLENDAGTIARLRVRDPEREEVTLTLGGDDASHFSITQAGVLTFSKPLPDFELPADSGGDRTYDVTVIATEAISDDALNAQNTAEQTIAVTIINVDEPPVPAAAASGQAEVSFEEGTATTETLGTYVANDPESFAIAWTLAGPDAGDFTISRSSAGDGELRFLAEPDFEAPADANRDNVYQLTVRASDGTNTGTLPVTVTVTNRVEDATVVMSHVRPQADVPISATLTSPEGVSSAVTWLWRGPSRLNVGARALLDDLVAVLLSVTREGPSFTPMAADIGSQLWAQATFLDGQGVVREIRSLVLGQPTPLVHPPPPANTAPLFDPDAVDRSVAEGDTPGRTIGAPVGATDDDSWDAGTGFGNLRDQDALIYTLDRAAAAVFDIDRTSGQLRTKAPLDFETRTTYTVVVTVADPSLATDTATVTITVTDVDEDPVLSGPRVVFHGSGDDDLVVATFRAVDPDGGDITWGQLQGNDGNRFTIDDGALEFLSTPDAANPRDANRDNIYEVTVVASDGTPNTVTHNVIVAVTSEPPRLPPRGGGPFVGGGPPIGIGGGGGPTGPEPSDVDFEWNVERDIEALDGGHDWATGLWGDGSTLWIAENGPGDDDAVLAYDLESRERVPEREFELDETNRAPRGIWSDGETMWVSDSGRDRLFAYTLGDGERLPGRDIMLDGRNRDPRGIWGDGDGVLWVLDGRTDALFAYDRESGRLLGEYDLHSANGDPRGIWSDGVAVWVSDHGAKRLFAYRLPALPEGAPPEEPPALERVPGEDFEEPGRIGNNSPRGVWGDGDVIYVADENDNRVYTYNIPDAIDARLASLALGDVGIGDFSPLRTEYRGTPDAAVAETTVAAEATQPGATVAIDPPDADGDARNGHQAALEGREEITVTVTSADGSRTRAYRVRFSEPLRHCMAGAVSEGLSLVVYGGGSVEDLDACARSRSVTALYALRGGAYLAYILGAPELVNRAFLGTFAEGVPPLTPLIVRSDGPPSADPVGARAAGEPWPECLRGAVATGLSAVLYEGGAVEDLVDCARGRGVTALYGLRDGEWSPYIIGAPEFVNRAFRELFGEGLPAVTPLIVKRDEPAPDAEASTGGTSDGAATGEAGSAGENGSPAADAGGETPAQDAATEQRRVLMIGNTDGVGVSHRNDCADEARLPGFGWADAQEVEVVEDAVGRCAGWLLVQAGDVRSWVREEYLLEP